MVFSKTYEYYQGKKIIIDLMKITIGNTERNVEVKYSRGWNEELVAKQKL